VAELHDLAGELQRTDTASGVLITARLPATVAARFQRYAVSAGGHGGGDGPRGIDGNGHS
jgi:GTP-binding protein HflX